MATPTPRTVLREISPFDEMTRHMRRWLAEPSWFADEEGEPAFDLYRDEESKELVAVASLPGFKKNEITVSVENGVLTVSAERSSEEEEKKAHYYRRERRSGAVMRSVALPTAVKEDQATAELKDGELILRLPIAENGAAKPIAIQG